MDEDKMHRSSSKSSTRDIRESRNASSKHIHVPEIEIPTPTQLDLNSIHKNNKASQIRPSTVLSDGYSNKFSRKWSWSSSTAKAERVTPKKVVKRNVFHSTNQKRNVVYTLYDNREMNSDMYISSKFPKMDKNKTEAVASNELFNVNPDYASKHHSPTANNLSAVKNLIWPGNDSVKLVMFPWPHFSSDIFEVLYLDETSYDQNAFVASSLLWLSIILNLLTHFVVNTSCNDPMCGWYIGCSATASILLFIMCYFNSSKRKQRIYTWIYLIGVLIILLFIFIPTSTIYWSIHSNTTLGNLSIPEIGTAIFLSSFQSVVLCCFGVALMPLCIAKRLFLLFVIFCLCLFNGAIPLFFTEEFTTAFKYFYLCFLILTNAIFCICVIVNDFNLRFLYLFKMLETQRVIESDLSVKEANQKNSGVYDSLSHGSKANQNAFGRTRVEELVDDIKSTIKAIKTAESSCHSNSLRDKLSHCEKQMSKVLQNLASPSELYSICLNPTFTQDYPGYDFMMVLGGYAQDTAWLNRQVNVPIPEHPSCDWLNRFASNTNSNAESFWNSSISLASNCQKSALHTKATNQLYQYNSSHVGQLFKSHLPHRENGFSMSLLDVAKVNKLGKYWNLNLSKEFPDMGLTEIGFILLRQFNAVEAFKCSEKSLLNYLSRIESQYKQVPYHNSIHAAEVAHLTACLMRLLKANLHMDNLEASVLILSAICHDVGHPGTSNAFLVTSGSELSLLYNDESVLENYHAAVTFVTMWKRNCSILKHLSKEVYTNLRRRMIQLILSTDMAHHFEKISLLRIRRNAPDFSPFKKESEDRSHVSNCLLKAADIGHAALDWPHHHEWAMKICAEFFHQGDIEALHGLPKSPWCDRFEASDIHEGQAGFLLLCVKPLFDEIYLVSDKSIALSRICRQIEKNADRWRHLSSDHPDHPCKRFSNIEPATKQSGV